MALHHAVARNEITKEENLVSPFCNLAWLVCLAQSRCPGRHYQVSGAKRFFSLRLPRWWSPSHDNQLWTKKQNLLGLSFSLCCSRLKQCTRSSLLLGEEHPQGFSLVFPCLLRQENNEAWKKFPTVGNNQRRQSRAPLVHISVVILYRRLDQ